MSGCWVTWLADIAVRAEVRDITPYLAAGVAALSDHPDIDDADYEHDAASATVSFTLLVRYGISEVFVRRQALDALHDCLPPLGFATSRHTRVLPAPVAWLQFSRWPTDFSWG
jgi:hypothetical protein